MIVDGGGVGYKVFVSKNTLKLLKKKSEIELFIWPYLKRETIELYGCPSRKEFEIFEALEAMPGIGPKTALALASFGSWEKLKSAIEEKDRHLDQLKGLGKKKLQRLTLELGTKIGDLKKKTSFEKDEVLEALVALGFSRQSASSALFKVSKNIKEPDERIRQALKLLGQR